MERLLSLPNRNLITVVVAVLITVCAGGASAQETSTIQSAGSAPRAAATPAAPTASDAQPGWPKPVGNIVSQPAPRLEDWSTPSLKGSELTLDGSLVGEKYDDPAFTREFIRVQWRPGDPIDLYLIKPAGVKNPPVILYLYSYPFETDRFHDNDFCKFLTKNGFAAVGFASALTGQRYHSRPMKEWFVSELQESLATTAHDVQMILNYLTQRGDIDTNRVGMFGDGSGATIAILAAAVDPRIKTLDLLDPWGDWPDWVAKSSRIPENERPNLMKPEFLAAVAPLDPVKWLPELKTPKIRIQHVATVTVTPNEVRQRIEAAAPPQAQIIRYQDRKAFLSAAAGGKGFAWIQEQLQLASAQ